MIPLFKAKHTRIKILTTGFFIAFSFSTLFAQTSFSPFQSHKAGSAPTVSCIGDVNNDGLADVLLCTGYGETPDPTSDLRMFVYQQTKQGTLSNPTIYKGFQFTPFSIAIGDVNNDMLNDVVIGYDDSVGIFYQNNTGGLNQLKGFYSGNFSRIDGLDIGDLNGDGLTDIALSHWDSKIVTILYQKINGSFYLTTLYLTLQTDNHILKIADINNDKRDDIIVSINEGLALFYQTADGHLSSCMSVSNLNSLIPVNGLAIGDLNNDGLTDVAQSLSGEATDAKIFMYLQDKVNHDIHNPSNIVAHQNPEAIQIADINCDGGNEIIVAHGGEQTLTIYEQNGGLYSTFKSVTIADASHFNPYGMSIGDINNDTKKDIALADYKNGLVTLINTSTTISNCNTQLSAPSQPSGTNSICKLGASSIYKSTAPLADSILWNVYPNDAGIITTANNDSCVIVWNDTWYGKANITAKALYNNEAIGSLPLTITVHTPPLDLGKDSTICKNKNITLKANSLFDSYVWNNGSTDSILTVSQSGVYSVTAQNVCGAKTDTIIISTQALPSITIKGDTILCKGSSMSFDVTQQGTYSYLWQDGSTNPNYKITKAGSYSISIVDALKCKNTVSFIVFADSIPHVELPKDTIACHFLSIPVNLECAHCSYLWNDGKTVAKNILSSPGSYSVTVSNYCGSQSDTVSIALINMPAIALPTDTILCKNKSITLNAKMNGSYHFLWNDGNETSTRIINKSGVYSLTVSDEHNCTKQSTINVVESDIPNISLPQDTTFCDSISLIIKLPDNDYSYIWNNQTSGNILVINQEGTYTVTASNICGVKTDSIAIRKTDCNALINVPSAFSPNNDDRNDIIYAMGQNIENVHFTIYNRLGQIMFETNDITRGWDGKLNDRNVDVGIYFYIISAYSTKDKHFIEKQGSITLLR